MPTSPSPKPAKTTAEQALALASGAWHQIGVSGWASSHEDWAVDLEPLIVFTAWLDDRDIRLRDEATDWCIWNWRFISRTRLRNLARRQPKEVQSAVGEFTATVAQLAGIPWPGATEPRPFKVTGRSVLSPLERPAMVWIRLRSMFGLGARSEILRVLLSRPRGAASVALLADATGYTKRTVADECETLELAGLLSVRVLANRFLYSLARREELEALLGDLPSIRPDWTAMFNVARELVMFDDREDASVARTLPVHARKTLDRIHDDLDHLDIDISYADVHGKALTVAVHDLAASSLAKWSVGTFPSHESSASPTRVSTMKRVPRS
jgi:hypothetical protein